MTILIELKSVTFKIGLLIPMKNYPENKNHAEKNIVK
jgi:hypothetical protein